MTARAPSLANPSAIARPRFEAPPVTMTMRPLRPRSTAAKFWRKSVEGGAAALLCLLLRRLGLAVAVQRAHERGGEAFQSPASARDEHLVHDVKIAFGQRVADGYRRRLRGAKAFDLRLVAFRLLQSERLDDLLVV